MSKYLFVGGPKDGQYRDVPGSMTAVKIPIYPDNMLQHTGDGATYTAVQYNKKLFTDHITGETVWKFVCDFVDQRLPDEKDFLVVMGTRKKLLSTHGITDMMPLIDLLVEVNPNGRVRVVKDRYAIFPDMPPEATADCVRNALINLGILKD